ncbi:MAG: TIGR00282 family metallophosphoesterase [Opitutaceae bacterium]
MAVLSGASFRLEQRHLREELVGVKLLFIGDIVGRPGREIISAKVPALRLELGLDFVIANGENAAAGSGITGSLARGILAAGVDAITLGDHVWDQKGWEGEIASFDRVCRPANLPKECPGRDHVILEKDGFRLAVFTVIGRNFVAMKGECPFHSSDELLARTVGTGKADGALIEIHAEATSEKQAMGWYFDGRAIAVLGTHTHVPTADSSILPKGTAFLCDAGMTGPYESVLGRDIKAVIGRFVDGMPRRFEVAEGDVRLSSVLVEFDPVSRRATKCELVTVRA